MIVKHLGLTDYQATLQKMQDFTIARNSNTPNELWVTSHNAVFTHGIGSKESHMLTKNMIPIVRTDRGGQITYHGVGQIVIYVLLDLKNTGIGVKKLVEKIEQAIIITLKEYGIISSRKANAPGVYVKNCKIAALGLKIKNSKTYHGLSLNVDMDLTPFSFINPCGYSGLKVCQMQDFVEDTLDITNIEHTLCNHLQTQIVTKL